MGGAGRIPPFAARGEWEMVEDGFWERTGAGNLERNRPGEWWGFPGFCAYADAIGPYATAVEAMAAVDAALGSLLPGSPEKGGQDAD